VRGRGAAGGSLRQSLCRRSRGLRRPACERAGAALSAAFPRRPPPPRRDAPPQEAHDVNARQAADLQLLQQQLKAANALAAAPDRPAADAALQQLLGELQGHMRELTVQLSDAQAEVESQK
jgi:hypothetical protein